MRHNPSVFGNKLTGVLLFVALWSILPLNIEMHPRTVYHKCWSHYDNVTENSILANQIGFFGGLAYQLVFLSERQYIELQCQDWFV